jgi:hypothetical protein
MKLTVKAGGKGGLTDANAKVVTTKNTTIDYNDVKSATVFIPKIGNLLICPTTG